MLALSVCFTQPSRSATGWLRLVGSFKLFVSFTEYRLFLRALFFKGSLAKETYDLKEPTSRSHPIAACLPRQDHGYNTTDELFRFQKNRDELDEMPGKLDSTKNPRSLETYPT